MEVGHDDGIRTESASKCSLKASVLAQNHTKLADMILSWTKEEQCITLQPTFSQFSIKSAIIKHFLSVILNNIKDGQTDLG